MLAALRPTVTDMTVKPSALYGPSHWLKLKREGCRRRREKIRHGTSLFDHRDLTAVHGDGNRCYQNEPEDDLLSERANADESHTYPDDLDD
jgi:hypothetical protein